MPIQSHGNDGLAADPIPHSWKHVDNVDYPVVSLGHVAPSRPPEVKNLRQNSSASFGRCRGMQKAGLGAVYH